MNKSGSYHHGNLRNALIVAAAELIEERGSPDFAISEAAKVVGVSPAAPYRHFKDKEALLAAVADLYFMGLAEATQATREAFPTGSRESILALGNTYLSYVSQRPEFYNLIWNEGGHGPLNGSEAERRPGFYNFVGAVEAWCQHNAITDSDPLELSVKLWAMAHGLSVLNINGQLALFLPETDVATLLSSSANTFLDGVEGKA